MDRWVNINGVPSLKLKCCRKLMFQIYEKTRENTTLLGTYCGTTSPPLMTSKHIFIVLFRSDIVNSARGFRATFYKTEGNILCLTGYQKVCYLKDKKYDVTTYLFLIKL